MARWQAAFPAVIGAVMLSACGATAPTGSGLAVTQAYGYNTGVHQPGIIQPGRRQPWQEPYSPTTPQGPVVPPASQGPQGYPPGTPQGPAIPPASQNPQRFPPVQPGGTALDACIEHYVRGVNFIMAPTEQQLAALRESGRRYCLSQGGPQGPTTTF